MSKNIKLFALMFLISFAGFAQVGIGTTTPDASAALDITASDKGFLMPRMTTVQKDAIATPAVGLQVYDTDTNSVWTYNGTAWKEGSGGAGKFVDGVTPDIAYYDGKVGIGRNTFSDAHMLYVEGIKNTDGTNTAAKFVAIYEGTGTSAATFGLGAIAQNNSSAIINYAIGTQGLVQNLNAGGTINTAVASWPQLYNKGTVAWGSGLVSDTYNEGGTMTSATGHSLNVFNRAGASIGEATLSSMYMENAGTITGDAYGLWIGGSGAGSVGGDSYALYIDTPFTNVTGSNFAIYSSNTADSYINGNVGVGITAPQQKVHISGAMRLEPQAAAPANGALGDLYVGTDGNLYFHDGAGWKTVQLN